MVERNELRPDIEEEDADVEEDTMDTGVDRREDVEVRKEAVADAVDLAEEIDELVSHPTPENKTTLARIAEILSVPLGKLMKLFAREGTAVEESPKGIPEAVREKMVSIDRERNERNLRGAIISLLRELRGLKAPGGASPDKLIALLEQDEITQSDAGYVRKQLDEAVKAFDPAGKDPERMALYDQLGRFTRALFRYHDLQARKVTKPFAEEHPGQYAAGLMDLGVSPQKAVAEGQKRYDAWERKKRAHDEAHHETDLDAKWRYAMEALDDELDVQQPREEGEKEVEVEEKKAV